MQKLDLEQIPANDTNSLSDKTRQLGQQLEDAFHNKADPQKLQELVNAGAPVNYRLNYGLPIRLESEYVAALFYLLEGHKGDEIFKKNLDLACSQGVCGADNPKLLYEYTRTAVQFYKILSAPGANREPIPVNPKYLEYVKANAIHGRADPFHTNGSLIVAAGLQNTDLMKILMATSKQHSNVPLKENGAHVNFNGYFDSHGPIHSAILLDISSLKEMLAQGGLIGCHGIAAASLLHWVAVSARLDDSPLRQTKAITIAKCLLEHGETLESTNLFGTTVIDCATDKLKTFLLEHKLTSLPINSMTSSL